MKSNTQPRPAPHGETHKVISRATRGRKPIGSKPAPDRVETGRMQPMQEPGHPHRHFRWATQAHDAVFLAPEQWLEQASPELGSWWQRWHARLVAHGSGLAPAPRLGMPDRPPLMEAPGSYVLER